MAAIPLSRGLIALVDDADAPFLSAFRWHAKPRSDGNGHYAVRHRLLGEDGPRTIYMHRWLLNPTGALHVDHISGDGLDNRRCNIRVCTRSQNQANSPRVRNSTGLRGVHRDRERCFRAGITNRAEGRWHGKRWPDPIQAAFEYDQEALRRHGEFATLNFPCLRKGGA